VTWPAAPRLATGVFALLVASCATTGASDPAQDGSSAFRSIGPSRIPTPASPPRAGYAGLHTDYHPNGRPRSHGAYVRRGEQSVPHGLWTFWLPDGSRQGQGRFHLGSPVGCFAVWSHGHRVTGIAADGAIQPAACEPPPNEEADVVEAAHGGEAQPPVDFGFQSLIAPGAALGAESTQYVTRDPDMTWALSAIWRRRLGPLRFGGAAGVRAGEYDYLAVPVTLVGGWGQTVNSWLAVDVWGELGALFLRAQPKLENYAVGKEYFWTPLTAVQAEASWRIAGRLELSLAGRAELAIPRDVERTSRLCFGVCGAVTDTWSIGGFTPGVVLGLRFLVW